MCDLAEVYPNLGNSLQRFFHLNIRGGFDAEDKPFPSCLSPYFSYLGRLQPGWADGGQMVGRWDIRKKVQPQTNTKMQNRHSSTYQIRSKTSILLT